MKGAELWELGLFLMVAGAITGLFMVPSGDPGDSSTEDDSFEVKPGFSGAFPVKYTCNGRDISPPLDFSGVPDEAESIAVLMDDPDAPTRVFDHWVIWNITGETLPEDLPKKRKPGNGTIQGRNDFGDIGYGGPCPPTGSHTYRIQVYALEKRLDLEPGSTGGELKSAVEGKIVAKDTVRREYPG